MKYEYIAIYGPTASGKTDLSIKLAKALNGIIINFDSCQFKNYLHSLTMCPMNEFDSSKEYLFNFLNPKENFSVKDFINKFNLIKEKNKNIKILVGGSGFYLFCLLNGLNKPNYICPRINEEVNNNSKEYNWQLLKNLEPFTKLHVNDTYRVNNYLKFHLEYGYSVCNIKHLPVINNEKIFKIFLSPSKEELHKNIEKRTNIYFPKMVEEMIEFNKNYEYIEDNNIIGYKTIFKYLKNEISQEEAMKEINLLTKKYAKTQITFLKNKIKENLIISNSYNIMIEDIINNLIE
jgi:tRNA dimethylallyltransferase